MTHAPARGRADTYSALGAVLPADGIAATLFFLEIDLFWTRKKFKPNLDEPQAEPLFTAVGREDAEMTVIHGH